MYLSRCKGSSTPDAKNGRRKSVLIACMMWRWWTNRNKINAKEKVGGQENVVAQTRFWAGECKVFCSKVCPVETKEWKTPSGDRLKINIDGAFAASTRTGGWGFAVRDSTGQIRGSGAGALRYVASAAQAEAHACEQAARAAADWGMVDVILESDAQNLVRAMRST
jgi:hypothetical protein